MSSYYCVANGLKNGIYSNWNDCKKQVWKFPNCRYKKFYDIENAKKYMELYCSEKTDYYIQDEVEQPNKINNYFTIPK